jgi:long-chain acyl-CoA synthetase
VTPSEDVVLITGGTGFLGWYLAELVLKRSEASVAFLVRAESRPAAEARIRDLVTARLGQAAWRRYRSRIRVFLGDVAEPRLGLDDAQAAELSGSVQTIFHSAALTDFDKPYEEIRKVNASGTENVLAFAEACLGTGPLRSVEHISTVGIAGTHRGTFYEDQLFVGQEFQNSYEKTKFEAETLCLEYRRRGINVNIFRPSIIVGDSRTGYAGGFKVMYQPIHIFSLGLYSSVPADDESPYNIVPVDAVAEAIYRISATRPVNGTFHVTNSETVSGGFVFEAASRFFGYRDPIRIPLHRFDMSALRGFRRKLLEPYLPYFNLRGLVYDNTRAMAALRPTGFDWPKIDAQLLNVAFQYCLDAGFMTRNGGLDDECR